MRGAIVVQVSTGKTGYTGKAHFDNIKPIYVHMYNATVAIESFTRSAPADSAPINLMPTRPLIKKFADTFTEGPIAQSPNVMSTHALWGIL